MLVRGFQEVSKIPLLITKNQSSNSCLYPYSFGIYLFSSCYAFRFGNYWLVITKVASMVYVTSNCKLSFYVIILPLTTDQSPVQQQQVLSYSAVRR